MGLTTNKPCIGYARMYDNIRPDLKITVKSISRLYWGLRRV
nr:MAG TPA: hypothetical protein [Caudoviricetes sp.]